MVIIQWHTYATWQIVVKTITCGYTICHYACVHTKSQDTFMPMNLRSSYFAKDNIFLRLEEVMLLAWQNHFYILMWLEEEYSVV